jgi:hypothetical protein
VPFDKVLRKSFHPVMTLIRDHTGRNNKQLVSRTIICPAGIIQNPDSKGNMEDPAPAG